MTEGMPIWISVSLIASLDIESKALWKSFRICMHCCATYQHIQSSTFALREQVSFVSVWSQINQVCKLALVYCGFFQAS
ncbi:hypothetical protein DFA_08557 [Cavenderia fasciculata]|uniref:Uncharacterized protein n=1 Tax=Cavenderia fasciculata TaxID=261658 RepID=F4Q2Z7_CACFS|nr:uncharacterized protein DFA_08557 [Cavenderia fasciculata]EGG17561.1 hypothetical protein DFA_08557 [Cavenderia fasciculata]|eukprot:XP_004356045.1 hypothetical protein DFA_08557 [Cavenderia fasciculata]